MARERDCKRKCAQVTRPTLREIHNFHEMRSQSFTSRATTTGATMIETREFCKTAFINSSRWVNELKNTTASTGASCYDMRIMTTMPMGRERLSSELCRSKSTHLPRQRTIEVSRPRRSVSWADDLVNVHTYTKPRQRGQNGWQILKRRLSQVIKAIKEDIEF
eukprot:gene18150-19961_t